MSREKLFRAHPAGCRKLLIAARYAPTNPPGTPQSGMVVVPPKELKAFARVSIRSSNLTVDFSGSILECWMDDACIFVGDPSNSNAYQDITLINPRGRPTIAHGQRPFIEVNAQKTRLFNVSTRVPLKGGSFGSYVQVDDDESFLLDGLDTGLGNVGVRCDAAVCDPVIYAPGSFRTFPGVGWLKNLNISLQCGGNGIDWQAGNTLRISDSVIQGYAQYGVRAGVQRGGYGGFDLTNVYQEVGNCANPLGRIGQAGSDRARQQREDSRRRSAHWIVSPICPDRKDGLPLLHCRAARQAWGLEPPVRRQGADQWNGQYRGNHSGHQRRRQLRSAAGISGCGGARAGALWRRELCRADKRCPQLSLLK